MLTQKDLDEIAEYLRQEHSAKDYDPDAQTILDLLHEVKRLRSGIGNLINKYEDRIVDLSTNKGAYYVGKADGWSWMLHELRQLLNNEAASGEEG